MCVTHDPPSLSFCARPSLVPLPVSPLIPSHPRPAAQMCFACVLGYLYILMKKSCLLVFNVFLIYMNCPLCIVFVHFSLGNLLFKMQTHHCVCAQFMAVQLLHVIQWAPHFAHPPPSWWTLSLSSSPCSHTLSPALLPVPRWLGQPLRFIPEGGALGVERALL